MTSIGIMSMQRIRNYGSTLQAYALRRLILGVADDAVVSFVDYRPGDVLVKDQECGARTSRLHRTLAKVSDYNSVDAKIVDRVRFLNHKRTYVNRYLPPAGIPAQPNYDQDVDVLVIGSDEVFNCVQANTNVGYARDLFGHSSPARKIVSYAASFGNTTMAKIDEFGIRKDLEEDFDRFAAISVRDRNSADIVEALTGERPVINVDPALAFDYMRLESKIPSRRQHADKYILVYGYSGRLDDVENAALKRYAQGIGAKILCIGGVQGCCDRFVDCSPFELLAYFRDAEAIVTDTFHGTIFSMINAKPFGTIIRRSTGHNYGNEQKLGFLLETFDLGCRRVTDLTGIGDLLSTPIDAGSVDQKLAHERTSTLQYLTSAVAGGPCP